jgi:hypothetical protein
MYRDQEFIENAWVFASTEARTESFDRPRARGWVIGLSATMVIAALFVASAFGQTSGRISGTVKDIDRSCDPQRCSNGNESGHWR